MLFFPTYSYKCSMIPPQNFIYYLFGFVCLVFGLIWFCYPEVKNVDYKFRFF